MSKAYGERVRCRFVDIESREVLAYPRVVRGLREKTLRLPAVLIDGVVRYNGFVSPASIQRDLDQMLGSGAGAHRRFPSEEAPRPWARYPIGVTIWPKPR